MLIVLKVLINRRFITMQFAINSEDLFLVHAFAVLTKNAIILTAEELIA